jgi:hypothetical protein
MSDVPEAASRAQATETAAARALERQRKNDERTKRLDEAE